MKILISGSSGMVGTELRKQLAQNSTISFVHYNHSELDVLDHDQTRKIILKDKPDTIIHLAAQTNVDFCEKNPDECYKVNVIGTENLVRIAKEINALFVYPSTFYVYGGEKGSPYDDRVDKPRLDKIIGVYSKSKFQGEEVVRKKLNRYFIVRFGALFGGGKKDKKFVAKVIKLTKTEKNIKMINDRIVQPSSVKDTVNNLLHLIKTDKYGVYNMVGHGAATYYEYAQAILKYCGIKGVKIIPIKSSEFKETAPRAKNLSVINGKLQDIELDLMQDWKVSLKNYLEKLKKKIP